MQEIILNSNYGNDNYGDENFGWTTKKLAVSAKCTRINERAGYLLAGFLHCLQYKKTEPDEMFSKVGCLPIYYIKLS